MFLPELSVSVAVSVLLVSLQTLEWAAEWKEYSTPCNEGMWGGGGVVTPEAQLSKRPCADEGER